MKSEKKSKVKSKDLHIRVSTREKERLLKNAKKLEISLSEYIRLLILGKERNEESSTKEILVVALSQDIISYVQEKYGCEDDTELLRREKKLWKLL